MCSKPRIPKPPKVQAAPRPDTPEETATSVERSAGVQKRPKGPTLGRFDLRLPPSFQIPE